MKIHTLLLIVALQFLIVSTGSSWQVPATNDSKNEVKFVILHINDTYEITPLRRGTLGGLARVATLRKKLLGEYEGRVFTLHAGDFLSPSALSEAKVDGRRLAGQQMVEVLGKVGIDLITFGNHEFDLNETEFRERLKELVSLRSLEPSHGFPNATVLNEWNNRRRVLFSTNVMDGATQMPFVDVPTDRLFEMRTSNGLLRLGFLAVTLEFEKRQDNAGKEDKKPYAFIESPVDAAKRCITQWKTANQLPDVVVALTHQSLAGDERLAASVPEVQLILGGHEHDNRHCRVINTANSETASIYRADSNAISAYVHELTYDFKQRKLTKVSSHLELINDSLPEDPIVAAVANEWTKRAFEAFRESGYNPEEPLGVLEHQFDGRESAVRSRETNLTKLVGNAMLHVLPEAQVDGKVVLFNSGSLRIDDVIYPGQVTMLDVLKILPFGGNVVGIEVNGEALGKLLKLKGLNSGEGAFLQTLNVAQGSKPGEWLISGKPLKNDGKYLVAINDFLLSGKQKEYADEFAALAHEKVSGPLPWRDLLANEFHRVAKGTVKLVPPTQFIGSQAAVGNASTPNSVPLAAIPNITINVQSGSTHSGNPAPRVADVLPPTVSREAVQVPDQQVAQEPEISKPQVAIVEARTVDYVVPTLLPTVIECIVIPLIILIVARVWGAEKLREKFQGILEQYLPPVQRERFKVILDSLQPYHDPLSKAERTALASMLSRVPQFESTRLALIDAANSSEALAIADAWSYVQELDPQAPKAKELLGLLRDVRALYEKVPPTSGTDAIRFINLAIALRTLVEEEKSPSSRRTRRRR